MTPDEWVSLLDNEEVDRLTQEKQLELKSHLMTLISFIREEKQPSESTNGRADNVGLQPIDLVITALHNAIQAAMDNADVYTDDFKKFRAVEKPIEISLKDAEFILMCLQRYKKEFDDGKVREL